MVEMKGNNKRLLTKLSFISLTDSRNQSSARKFPRNFEEPNGVVGLGILAALKDDRNYDQNLSPNTGCRTAVLVMSPKSASNPIPIVGTKNAPGHNSFKKLSAEKMKFCEGYTCVTSHVGKNQIAKREYFEAEILGTGNGGGSEAVHDSRMSGGGEADFLSSCFLCEKMLHGLDVFMYRGEKAFCSAECRLRQISIDEKKEKFRSGLRKSIKLSASPCSVAAA